MRKLLIVMILGVMVMALWGCARRVSEVTAIDLNWVPQQWYQREDYVNLGEKSVTLHYSKAPTPIVVTLLDDEVTVSGTGIKHDNGTILLNTDAVGRYTVTITAEGVSISFEYFVDDTVLLAALNQEFVPYPEKLDPSGKNDSEKDIVFVINNCTTFLVQMGLDTYCVGGELKAGSVWYYSVLYTRNALFNDQGGQGDGNPRTNGKFPNAYRAKQVIEASFLHGVFSGEAAGEYLNEVLFPTLVDESFEFINWDIMAFNLLELWDLGNMTHMETPGIRAIPGWDAGWDSTGWPPEQTIETLDFLANVYRALMLGSTSGEQMILHPSYKPLHPGMPTFLYTTNTWPGLLALGIDEDLAVFLQGAYPFGVTPPPDYQTMGFAIINYLVSRYYSDDPSEDYGYFLKP